MKKQIFILVLAILTTTSVLGQTYMKAGAAPRPLTGCTTDATHPLAGVPYNYAIEVNPAGGTFQWWATTDVNFISTNSSGVTTNNIATKLAVGAAAPLLYADANYGISGSLDNVGIIWSSSALAAAVTTPTFVAVQYDALSPSCANNFKVYQITPVNGFTVDIKNMDQAKTSLAYDATTAFCVSNIVSAAFSGGAIVTDYGSNILYFEVVAANFTGSYTPFFQVSGLQGTQAVTSLELFTDAAMATAVIQTNLATGAYSPGAPVGVDASVNNTSTGVSLYVKLTIANNTYESLNDVQITLAVNGTNASAQNDVVNTACNTSTDYEDTAVQTITKRPTVTSVLATGVFVTP